MIGFRIQSSSLMLPARVHTHTHKLFHATLKYAENKCFPLISRNSQHPEENFLKAKIRWHPILTWLLTLFLIQFCVLKQ